MTIKQQQKQNNTKSQTKKFIEEANFDTEAKAKDVRDYEAMLIDFVRKELEA